MAKQPENLYQRDGVWWIRYNAGGRKIRRSLGTKSQREAVRLRNEILGKRDKSKRVADTFGLEGAKSGAPIPTFGQVADRFMAQIRASDLRPHTIRLREEALRLWILPRFGDRVISTVTRDDVIAWLAYLQTARRHRRNSKVPQKVISSTFRAQLLALTKRIFRFALQRGVYQGPNPADLDRSDPAKPRPKHEKRAICTREQAEAILAALPDQFSRMALLALSTGLRWGEICGLEWPDVDLDTGRLQVRRSYDGPPKNEASTWPIYLDAGIVATLRTWKAEGSGEGRLFARDTGEPYEIAPKPWRERLRAAARSAGVADWQNFTPHSFRHSFGSWEYERTGDPKYVQRIMRHARIEVTLATYVHDRRDDRELVVDRPALAPRPKLKAVP